MSAPCRFFESVLKSFEVASVDLEAQSFKKFRAWDPRLLTCWAHSLNFRKTKDCDTSKAATARKAQPSRPL